MTGQNAPAKMLVRPLIEKAAEHVARARAAIKVAVVTVTLRAGLGVTVGLRFFARWRRCRSALVGSARRRGVTLVLDSSVA